MIEGRQEENPSAKQKQTFFLASGIDSVHWLEVGQWSHTTSCDLNVPDKAKVDVKAT